MPWMPLEINLLEFENLELGKCGHKSTSSQTPRITEQIFDKVPEPLNVWVITMKTEVIVNMQLLACREPHKINQV